MSMGLPVIVTDWGGSTQFIKEEHAYPIKVSVTLCHVVCHDRPVTAVSHGHFL